MIGFKQFITESRSAPLYHGTSVSDAVSALKDGILRGVSPHSSGMFDGKKYNRYRRGDSVYGVSLTRSFNISKRFGQAIFELDQQSLTHNHKIVPYQWLHERPHQQLLKQQIGARSYKEMGILNGKRVVTIDRKRNELEEFVLGSIKNLDKHLIALWLPIDTLPNLTHPKIMRY